MSKLAEQTINKLRRYLDENNITPPDAAALMGVSSSTVFGWLAERNTPGGDNISKIKELMSIQQTLPNMPIPWYNAPPAPKATNGAANPVEDAIPHPTVKFSLNVDLSQMNNGDLLSVARMCFDEIEKRLL